MARRFFNPENTFWKLLGYFGDLVVISLLWCVCSVPLVTIGPATAALYDTTVRCLRRGGSSPFARFFEVFRRELKEGILLTLVWAGAAVILGVLVYFFFRVFPSVAERGALVTLIELLIVFFFLAVVNWVFPTLSRFSMGIGTISSSCLRLAAGHILRSAAMAILNGLAIFACTRFVVPVMFAPAVVSLLSSCLLEPVFSKYETTPEPVS